MSFMCSTQLFAQANSIFDAMDTNRYMPKGAIEIVEKEHQNYWWLTLTIGSVPKLSAVIN